MTDFIDPELYHDRQHGTTAKEPGPRRTQADSGGISVKRKELVWDGDKLLKLMTAE